LDVSVPWVRFADLCIQSEMTLRPGFPIRKSADQRVLAPPHSLSQRATSFIASQCQGIHQMPLNALSITIAHSEKQTPHADHRHIQQVNLEKLQTSLRRACQDTGSLDQASRKDRFAVTQSDQQ